MPRTTTVKLDKDGYLHVKLPVSVRKQLPADCTFELHANGNSLRLEPVRSTRDEDWADFDAARESIRRRFAKRKVTMGDIRRTIKQVRAEQNAKRGSG